MKHYELEQIAAYLRQFKKIHAIERVDDTVIRIEFDRHVPLYFDMRRGDSHIFTCKAYARAKIYQAPFDVLLRKYFMRAALLHVEAVPGNRILRIEASASSQYKTQTFTLQLEFTGRNTNAIIVDANETVQEALRHIDELSLIHI